MSGWQNANCQSSSKRPEDSSSKEKTVETTNEKKRRERENAETTIGKNAEREGERDWKEE